jgi:hypothetical protein
MNALADLVKGKSVSRWGAIDPNCSHFAFRISNPEASASEQVAQEGANCRVRNGGARRGLYRKGHDGCS